MATITKSDVIQKQFNEAGIDGQSKPAVETSDKIVWTYGLNPEFSNIQRHVSITGTSSGSTLYSVGSNEDFYLTSATLQNQTDVTADNVLISMSATIDGVSRIILGLRKITTTVFSDSITFTPIFPLKVDRGTNITFSNAFTVGASVSVGTITGLSRSRTSN